MAIPLKNGADLYNFEVLRMRFHNLGADPSSDFGVGQVYFNTSTSEGSGKRVRIYDGSAFRSLAYLDEFTALQTKVNAFLDGGVDADGVLENLAEIQKFLDNYSSATDLSKILDTKLDKENGKAKNLAIVGSGTSYLAFESTDGTSYGSLGISSAHEAKFWDGAGAYTLLHSGNVGEYKAGDSDMLGGIAASRYFLRNSVITSDTQDPDTWDVFGFARLANNGGDYLNWPDAYGYVLNYKDHESNRAGFQLFAKASGNVLLFRRHWDSWGDWKTIAFTDSDITGYAAGLKHSNGTVGATVDANGNLTFAYGNMIRTYDADGTARNILGLNSTTNELEIGVGTRPKGLRTTIAGNDIKFWVTGANPAMLINSSGNVTIGDSDLAKASYKLYVKGVGVFEQSDGTKILLEEGAGGTGGAGIAFFNSSFQMGTITAKPLIINAIGGGNVLIGTTTDNGEKLYVNGNVRATEIFVGTESKRYGRFTWASTGTADFVAESGNVLRLGVGSTRSMRIETDGLISLLNDTTINGNLHVTGNIIATGEVSAGGAGEEGDTGTGTGGGDALIYSQEFTPTTTSITITHNLSATKGVIVQVWEQNGNYWDMVLVDVEEVDTNTVTLFFGKTETTLHKVVIMG